MIIGDSPLDLMQSHPAVPIAPLLPPMPPPVAGPSSAYDRMIRMNRGYDSVSAATKRAMERDQNRARIFRERREAIQRTGNLPTYHDHTPEQDLDALKYGVPSGPYQFNMPGPGTSPALANKLARADAALASTMSQGTPKMRANPRTTQLARWRNMAALDAATPAAPEPVVRKWDQALMDKIHNRNTRAPMVDEAANDPLVKEVVALDDQQGGQGFMAVPAEPRGGKPEVGSPAFKRMQRMQKKVARATRRDPDDITQENIDDFLADKRDASRKYNTEVERGRRDAVTKKATDRATLRRSGQKGNDNPYHNVFMYGAMMGNTDLMNAALQGLSESEKTKAVSDAAAEDRKLKEKEITGQADDRALERQRQQQNSDAQIQLYKNEAKRQEMAGNQAAADANARHAETLEQMKLEREQRDQQHKENMAANDAKNKPLSDADIEAGIENAGAGSGRPVEEIDRQIRNRRIRNAKPGEEPVDSVAEDMKAGRYNDKVHEEMLANHPDEVADWWPDSWLSARTYKDTLFSHYRHVFPHVPSDKLRKLIAHYYAHLESY